MHSIVTCLPSPARRLGTARGGSCNTDPHYGRLASWYETGAAGPAVIHDIINISSLILLCWWYLHLRVHHRQPGDLALQEVDGITVVLTLGRLAPWNETGSGGGCSVLLITGPTQHYWQHLHLFAGEIYPDMKGSCCVAVIR